MGKRIGARRVIGVAIGILFLSPGPGDTSGDHLSLCASEFSGCEEELDSVCREGGEVKLDMKPLKGGHQ